MYAIVCNARYVRFAVCSNLTNIKVYQTPSELSQSEKNILVLNFPGEIAKV